jgi:hypothetical protein
MGTQTFEPAALDAVILGKSHASEKEFEECYVPRYYTSKISTSRV